MRGTRQDASGCTGLLPADAVAVCRRASGSTGGNGRIETVKAVRTAKKTPEARTEMPEKKNQYIDIHCHIFAGGG